MSNMGRGGGMQPGQQRIPKSGLGNADFHFEDEMTQQGGQRKKSAASAGRALLGAACMRTVNSHNNLKSLSKLDSTRAIIPSMEGSNGSSGSGQQQQQQAPKGSNRAQVIANQMANGRAAVPSTRSKLRSASAAIPSSAGSTASSTTPGSASGAERRMRPQQRRSVASAPAVRRQSEDTISEDEDDMMAQIELTAALMGGEGSQAAPPPQQQQQMQQRSPSSHQTPPNNMRPVRSCVDFTGMHPIHEEASSARQANYGGSLQPQQGKYTARRRPSNSGTSADVLDVVAGEYKSARSSSSYLEKQDSNDALIAAHVQKEEDRPPQQIVETTVAATATPPKKADDASLFEDYNQVLRGVLDRTLQDNRDLAKQKKGLQDELQRSKDDRRALQKELDRAKGEIQELQRRLAQMVGGGGGAVPNPKPSSKASAATSGAAPSNPKPSSKQVSAASGQRQEQQSSGGDSSGKTVRKDTANKAQRAYDQLQPAVQLMCPKQNAEGMTRHGLAGLAPTATKTRKIGRRKSITA